MDTKILLTNILPVAVCFAVSLVFSNEAYIYLSVSYIQMLKAFTPVAVLLLSVLSGLTQSSLMEVSIISIICLGVALTSAGELRFSAIGFVYQSLGILAESTRLVMTNFLMAEVKLDPLSSLYYIAPCCAVLLSICCFYFESESLPWHRIISRDFVGILLLNGVIAFTLNVAVVMLIKNTSALVLTLAGVAKDLLLVVLSVLIFGAPVTPLQYAGYTVALIGLNLHKEFKKSPDNIVVLLARIAVGIGLVPTSTPTLAVTEGSDEVIDAEEGVALIKIENALMQIHPPTVIDK